MNPIFNDGPEILHLMPAMDLETSYRLLSYSFKTKLMFRWVNRAFRLHWREPMVLLTSWQNSKFIIAYVFVLSCWFKMKFDTFIYLLVLLVDNMQNSTCTSNTVYITVTIQFGYWVYCQLKVFLLLQTAPR